MAVRTAPLSACHTTRLDVLSPPTHHSCAFAVQSRRWAVTQPPSARYVPGCLWLVEISNGRRGDASATSTTASCVAAQSSVDACRKCLVAAATSHLSCWYSACANWRSFVCRSVLHSRHRSTDSPDSKWNLFHFMPGCNCEILTGRPCRLICSGEVESSSAAQPGDARILELMRYKR